MEGQRDVIVVGAGPSGAVTAAFLAQRGYDVLLLDRKGFPRDKICGDAVPASGVELLFRLGLEEDFYAHVERGEFYRVTQMLLVSPKGRDLITPFAKRENGIDSYIAPRIYFDEMIQRHAVKSGAEFRVAQVKGPLVENGRVVGVEAKVNGRYQPICSKFVVGADGATSTIARTLREPDDQYEGKHRAIAIRAYLDDMEEIPQTVEFYLYDDILPGYAWIFPVGKNTVNIGLGMRVDLFRKDEKNLDQMLARFMEIPAIKKRLLNGGELKNKATWQLNFGSQRHKDYVFDGALLVGDAAGFVNPLTGGGIHNGMISGEMAAKTIHEALSAGNTSGQQLKIYEHRCYDTMWDGMKASYRIQLALLYTPFAVDWLMKIFREHSSLTKIFLSKL
jgi:geranylgeranyl reductase family protein